MKSLTLHNIDEPLLALVKEKAKEQKKSANQFLKELIEKSLGYKKPSFPPYYNDFKDLCGMWTHEDRTEFENNTKDFEEIEGNEWE